MDSSIHAEEQHALPITGLINATFQGNYKKFYEENINTKNNASENVIDLSCYNVHPLKFVLPIRLVYVKNEDRDMFNELKIYCQSKEYQKYGNNWPTEAADSLSLDSLLDWDFEKDEKEMKRTILYDPNELLVVTEKTIHVHGFDNCFHFGQAAICDVIVIPNFNDSHMNDTCLVSLDTGDIVSMNFMYDSGYDFFIIEPVCTWKSQTTNTDFKTRFILSKDGVVGLVSNFALMSVIKLHRREPAFFKVEYNVLLEPDFLFSTVSWYGSTLAYIQKKDNIINLIKYNSNRAESFINYEILDDEASNKMETLFLLDDDKFLTVNYEARQCFLHISQEEKENIEYMEITSLIQLHPHFNVDLERIINKSLRVSHFLILAKHILSILAITSDNHIVFAFLTKLNIAADTATISRITTDAYLYVHIDSIKEIYEYKIDISNIKFHPIKEYTEKPLSLLQNIANEKFIIEGYQPIIRSFHHANSIYLQSQNKLYPIEKKSECLTHLQQLSWLPNFHIFSSIKLIDIHQQPIVGSHIGPIEINKASHSHQYIIIGISTTGKNEAFYVHIYNNLLISLNSVDDLLPEKHINPTKFLLAAFLHSFFVIVTPNLIYLNNFDATIELPSSFTIKNCLLLPSTHSDCPTILIWNPTRIELLAFPHNSYDTKKTVVSLPKDNYCHVSIYHNSNIIVASNTKYYIYDLISMKCIAQFSLSTPLKKPDRSLLMQTEDHDHLLKIFSPTDSPFPSLLQNLTPSICLFYSPSSIYLHNSLRNDTRNLVPSSTDISSKNTLLSASASASASLHPSPIIRHTFFFLLYDTGLCIAKVLPSAPKSGLNLPFHHLIPILPHGFLSNDASSFYHLSSKRLLSTNLTLSQQHSSTILSSSLVATDLHALFSYHSFSNSLFISLLRLQETSHTVLFELTRIHTIVLPTGSTPVPILNANSGIFHVFEINRVFFVYAIVKNPVRQSSEQQWSCIEWCRSNEKIIPGLIPMIPVLQ